MYCSELVYKLFNRALGIKLGQLQPLKNYDLSHPVVKRVLKKRYGARVPYNEPMISPQSVFASELLYTVVTVN